MRDDATGELPDAQLSAYLDDELTAQEREAVERALQETPALRRRLDALRAVDDALRGLPAPVASPELAARVRERVAAERPVRPPSRRAAPRRRRLAAWSAVAAAAALVVMVLWRIDRRGEPPDHRPAAQLEPGPEPVTELPALPQGLPATPERLVREEEPEAESPDPPAQPDVPEVVEELLAAEDPPAVAPPASEEAPVVDGIEAASDEELQIAVDLEALDEDLEMIAELELLQRLAALDESEWG